MKKYILFLLAVLAFNKMTAQEGEEVGWVSRFGIAGGFNPVMIFPNLNPINAEIKKMGIEELTSSGFMLWGGSGYAYIMMIDNLRLGGIGFGGSTSSSGKVNGFDKEVIYRFGLGGLTIEYTLPFIKNIGVSVGTIVGYGSTTIEIYQSNTNYSWDLIWSKVKIDNGIMSRDVSDKISQSYLLFSPTLNFDIPINRFISARIGGGYNFTFNKNWKVNNNRNVSGIPSDLTANSFFIQTGIYFGFFAY